MVEIDLSLGSYEDLPFGFQTRLSECLLNILKRLNIVVFVPLLHISYKVSTTWSFYPYM